MICRKYLMACKFIWVESCFGWKIILHIGKWVKCHWLLKNDLKTSTYDIWFLCILFVSFFCFFKQFWAIYEFSWFYSFYFWILIVTCSYESLEGFHARFEIFRFLYEQWYKFKIEIVKVGKILGCLNFGSADSPRVRGGQSAVHGTCSPEKFSNRKNTLQTVRQRTADGPPVLGSICQRQFQSGGGVKIQRRTVR